MNAKNTARAILAANTYKQPPKELTGEEPERETSLADMIIQAYETRLETDPEAAKWSIQHNLDSLPPEEAEKLLKELLERGTNNNGTEK